MTADETQEAPADASPNTGEPAVVAPVPAPPPAPPALAPAPAPAPGDPIAELALNLALAEALKPLEGPINDVYSADADKAAARKKLNNAYTAAMAVGGPLRTKLDAAEKSFNRAVTDMDKDGRLDKWIAFAFADANSVKALLTERASLAAVVTAPMGKNEKARADAQAATKQWAARYADWSAPVDKITAQIGQYAEKIDKLNADINNDVSPMTALTTFWLEVAPRHLQLEAKLDDPMKTAVGKVAGKLGGFDDRKNLLDLGADRFDADGSLYAVATGDDAEAKRKTVLGKWKAAAVAQAHVEADFKLHPDDIASARQRYDKLKDDGWIAAAKAIPEPS